MRRCIWCRKFKKTSEIKTKTTQNQCCCRECARDSLTLRETKLKMALRTEIVRVLRRDGPLSAAELGVELGGINGRRVGSIAQYLFQEGEIDHEPHPTLRRLWLWKALPDTLPESPKIGRPKGSKTKPAEPDPIPMIAPEPEPLFIPTAPSAVSIMERKLDKLKRNSSVEMHGVTEDDLLWQAKYLAQAEWRKQRAINA